METSSFKSLLLVFVACSAMLSCDSRNPTGVAPTFQHSISGVATPWTHSAFDTSDSKFSFAVFSDLTGGEREKVFDIGVAQLSMLRPELIMNVGDLIVGDTEDSETIKRQWRTFDKRAAKATAPIFYTGGNHDLSNRSLQAAWRERHGPAYYHFVYKNVLFLVLDTEDAAPERAREVAELREQAMQAVSRNGMAVFENTDYARLPEQFAGAISEQQSRYFQRAIADNPDVYWTFLFMHKAPWENPLERNFRAIEKILGERPYTVFHGHAHAYRYLQRHGRDYIRLATTGGVQLPDRGRSVDHLLMVTVSEQGVDIANLLMSGILDKTGHVPLGGDDVCFEAPCD